MKKKANWFVITLIFAVIGIIVWYKYTRFDDNIDGSVFSDDCRYPVNLSVSADGTQVAIHWEKGGFGVFDLSHAASFQAQEQNLKFRGGDPDGTACSVISPDGKTVLTGGAKGFITEWNSMSTKSTRRFRGHTEWIGALAWCPDGKAFLSAGGDKLINLWDAKSAKLLRMFSPMLLGMPVALAISPDGKLALSAVDHADGIIQVWDIPSGKMVCELAAHGSTVCSVAFSPDGEMAVSASHNRTVRLWKVADWSEVRKIELAAPWGGVYRRNPGSVDAAFTADSRHVLIGRYAGLQLWDVRGGEVATRFEDSYGALNLAILPNGTQALSISERGIFQWDLGSGDKVRILKEFRLLSDEGGISYYHPRVMPIGFVPKSNDLVTCSSDGTTVWDIKTLLPISTMNGCNPRTLPSSLTKDGSRILSLNPMGVWDTSTGKNLWTKKVRYWDGAISDDGGYAIVSKYGDPITTIEIWDAKKGEALHTFEFRPMAVQALAVSPDNRLAASIGSLMDVVNSSKLTVWDVQTGKVVKEIETSGPHVPGPLSFSPDNTMVILGYHQGQTWDLASGKMVSSAQNMPKDSYVMAFSSDGMLGICEPTSNNLGLAVWDVNAGKMVRPLAIGKESPPQARRAVFSPDNRFVAAGHGEQASLRVWDVATGALMWEMPRTRKGVLPQYFTRD